VISIVLPVSVLNRRHPGSDKGSDTDGNRR